MKNKQKRFRSILPSGVLSSYCVYCGEYARHREHFVPFSYSGSPYYVPSCKECNLLLGRKRHDTLAERCAYLQRRYEKRYEDYLRADYVRLIEETEGILRRRFVDERQEKRRVMNKLYHLDFLAQTAHIALSALDPYGPEVDRLVDLLDSVLGLASRN